MLMIGQMPTSQIVATERVQNETGTTLLEVARPSGKPACLSGVFLHSLISSMPRSIHAPSH